MISTKRCGYVDGTCTAHISTAQTTTTMALSNPKKGHLYFVNQGTFLLWVDSVLKQNCKKLTNEATKDWCGELAC